MSEAVLTAFFEALELIAGPAASKLGLERYCAFITTRPALVSMYAEGRDGHAIECGAAPLSPAFGAAVARFLEEGLKRTQDDQGRALIARAQTSGRASLALFADPVQGRVRAWLVPTGKTLGDAVALFELREATQVH